MSEITAKLAALTAKTERIIQRAQLRDVQTELRLARERDPRAVRDAIRAAGADAGRERQRTASAAATATGDLALANLAREANR